MPLLSDREAFDRAAMRKVEKDWQRIGELVYVLSGVDGQLILGDGINSPGDPEYFVMWRQGGRAAIGKAETLLDALEKVRYSMKRQGVFRE